MCTCAHLLVHVPRLRVDGATQPIKQRHEETEIGLLLGVVDRVVPAASREGPASCMRVTQCISTRKAPGQNHKSLKGIQHVIADRARNDAAIRLRTIYLTTVCTVRLDVRIS